MGAHTTHRMHGHSLAAFDDLDLSKRAALVLSCFLLADGPLTDRECQKRLGFAERGAVQPRISDLVLRGLLMESKTVTCEVTGKQVRACVPTSLARKGGG